MCIGQVVIPDRTSENFFSFIGSIDKRPKLDTNIKRGDVRYNAALSMMASKLSYENEAHIQDTVSKKWEVGLIFINDDSIHNNFFFF